LFAGSLGHRTHGSPYTSAQKLKSALADRIRFLPTEEQGELLLQFFGDTNCVNV
jgi:hypothetical protein